MEGKTVIEINGVKMEVDLRTAKRIDEIRVGDRVKVLKKVYDGHKVHSGTVIGFEPFKALPTMIIAYLDVSYSGAKVEFVYFNTETKDTEVIKAIDDDQLDIDKATVLQQMARVIQQKQDEVADLEAKRQFFLDNFKAYWPELASVTP